MTETESGARIDAVTTIVKALDGYLIAALLIVVAIGLYELFIKPIEHATASPSGRRLHQIRDLEDLQTAGRQSRSRLDRRVPPAADPPRNG